jgi:mono/diheme cytochrome c family protein
MKSSHKGRFSFFLFPFSFFLLTACQQQMAEQPSYRPLERSSFFADERSARPLEAGTVARGQPLADSPLVTGRRGGSPEVRRAAAVTALASAGPLVALAPLATSDAPAAEYVNAFPFAVTRDDLQRGRQRYTIFCAVCHDPTGNGNGKIPERGYTHPPSYVTDFSRGFERRGVRLLLRDAPVGYYFEVVTQGYGAMPDYSTQVPPRDRWLIIAYIRALQLSQYARLRDLPPEEREAARKQLEDQP